MSWQVTWEVIRGARGRRSGSARADDGAEVWQGETVRFRVGLEGSDRFGDLQLALEERNWRVPPTLTVTGTSGTRVTVAHARDDALTFEYRFLWEGDKTLRFRGSARARVRSGEAPAMSSGGGSPMPLFPDLDLEQAFRVRPEASPGEAAAETTGSDHRGARARERQVEEGRRQAAAERTAERQAGDRDSTARQERFSGVRDGRPGILPMDLQSDGGLAEQTVDAVREYALDLRAAIRVTSPLDLTANRWTWTSARGSFPLRGATFRGRWTWRRHAEGTLGFYFAAASMLGDDQGRTARPLDGDETEAVRGESELVYRGDEWLLARFAGQPRAALFRASDLAVQSTLAVALEIFQAIDTIVTVFDVLVLIGSARAIVRGIARAGRALLRRGEGAAARLLGRAEARTMAGAARESVSEARGLGAGARGLGDDLPAEPYRSPTEPAATEPPPTGARGTGAGEEPALLPYITGGGPFRPIEMAHTGLTSAQISVLSRMTNRPLTAIPASAFADTWELARRRYSRQIDEIVRRWEAGLHSGLSDRARTVFGQVREEFYRRLAANPTVRGYFTAAGMTLPTDGRSPRLLMNTLRGRREVSIDFDHIRELGTHPAEAFDASNLRFTFERQNRMLHNLLLRMDPFQPDARLTHGTGVTRAGRLRGVLPRRSREPGSEPPDL